MNETRSHPLYLGKASAEKSEQVTYSDDGVDLTLIRSMLSLTTSERSRVLQRNVESLAWLCNESLLLRGISFS